MTEALMYKTQTELEKERVLILTHLLDNLSPTEVELMNRLLELHDELTKRLGA